MPKTFFNKVDDNGNILPNSNIITSYGARDENAKILQKLLNRNGYKLDVNGTFDDLTLNALNDYQKNNGLTVSKYVGQDVWDRLSGGPQKTYTTTPATNPNTKGATHSSASGGGFGYKDYKYSDIVQQAYDAINAHKQTMPTYTSTYGDSLTAKLQEILSGKDFKYDLNGDALYQQYKDKYIQQGKMAMADTMGQAAAMTGGYGNSYAQSVGQQAYQAQLQNLNDIVPELYQMALDKYNMDKQALYDEYSLLADAENREYGEYRDKLSDYYAELDRLANNYYNERNFDYGKYADDKSFAYEQERDRVADEKWATELLLGGGSTKGATNDGIDYSGWSETDWRDYFSGILNEDTGGAQAAYDEYEYLKLKDFMPDRFRPTFDRWFDRLLAGE